MSKHLQTVTMTTCRHVNQREVVWSVGVLVPRLLNQI